MPIRPASTTRSSSPSTGRAISTTDSRAGATHPLAEWLDALKPRHTKLRGLVSRAFTPRSVARLEPCIHELAHALLDEHIDRRQMDLVADFCAPLPLMVIAKMLGVPAAEWRTFRRSSGR